MEKKNWSPWETRETQITDSRHGFQRIITKTRKLETGDDADLQKSESGFSALVSEILEQRNLLAKAKTARKKRKPDDIVAKALATGKPILFLRKKKSKPNATDFMVKALDAQKAGRITGGDVARAEAYINRGMQVPAKIVRAVNGGRNV
ncbi:MAG: hypothetical protein LBV44_05785 [Methylobacillus sp.]|jgi:hypothetical protein|nr:hypothetical protein [Methylobacillus sp.]